MDKEKVIQKIEETGIVAIVRAKSVDSAKKLVHAILEGGINTVEVTFTLNAASEVISQLKKEFNNDIIIGAGSVLDPETARIAILAGAQYIVSPNLNPDTIKLCNRYRIATMPGVMTPTEAVTAMELGADVLKIFPAGLFGPRVVKDFKGPLPHAKLMPTGGVTVDNAHEWIAAGACALGVGSELTKYGADGDYNKVTQSAMAFLEAVKSARK